MLFSKEDLTGYYKWAIEDRSSLFNGAPTRRLFDRWNGNQVLFIINSCADFAESFSVEDGKRIEDLIINHMPVNVNSEKSVFNWLIAEFLKNQPTDPHSADNNPPTAHTHSAGEHLALLKTVQ